MLTIVPNDRVPASFWDDAEPAGGATPHAQSQQPSCPTSPSPSFDWLESRQNSPNWEFSSSSTSTDGSHLQLSTPDLSWAEEPLPPFGGCQNRLESAATLRHGDAYPRILTAVGF